MLTYNQTPANLCKRASLHTLTILTAFLEQNRCLRYIFFFFSSFPQRGKNMPPSSRHSSVLMAGKMMLVSELKLSLSCLHVPRSPAPYMQRGRLDKPETPCSSFSFCENSRTVFFPHVPRGNQSTKVMTYKLNSADPRARHAAAHDELKIKCYFSPQLP